MKKIFNNIITYAKDSAETLGRLILYQIVFTFLFINVLGIDFRHAFSLAILFLTIVEYCKNFSIVEEVPKQINYYHCIDHYHYYDDDGGNDNDILETEKQTETSIGN